MFQLVLLFPRNNIFHAVYFDTREHRESIKNIKFLWFFNE